LPCMANSITRIEF
jgi:hypothetical protein